MSHARISDALRALVFEPDPDIELHQVLDRYDAPDYTHRSDGTTLSREIAIFGAFAEDGRFRRLSETGFDVEPHRVP